MRRTNRPAQRTGRVSRQQDELGTASRTPYGSKSALRPIKDLIFRRKPIPDIHAKPFAGKVAHMAHGGDHPIPSPCERTKGPRFLGAFDNDQPHRCPPYPVDIEGAPPLVQAGIRFPALVRYRAPAPVGDTT